MTDRTLIITPEEIPDLARRWQEMYYSRREPEATPLKERIRDHLRQRYFRRLASGYTPGRHVGKIDGSKIRRVLLVRYDALGDYICSTGLITWLRAACPHVEIDMISSIRNDPVARIDPNISETFPIDYQFKSVRPSKLEPLQRAATRDYDVAFGMAMSRMTKLAVVTAMVAPRAEKVSLRHHNRAHIYGELFTWQVEREEWRDHWANSFTRMASETIEPVAPAPSLPIVPYIVIGEEAWRSTERFLRSEGLGFCGFGDRTVLGKGWSGPPPGSFPGTGYVVLNISAWVMARQWNPAVATDVCRALLKRYPDRLIYVTGAPKEAEQVLKIIEGVASPRCRQLRLKLPEFFCFVAGASLVISPDTATVHIAASHRRPIVGLYSEKVKIVEWYPMGTDFVLLLSPDEFTINRIPWNVVMEGVERLEARIADKGLRD